MKPSDALGGYVAEPEASWGGYAAEPGCLDALEAHLRTVNERCSCAGSNPQS